MPCTDKKLGPGKLAGLVAFFLFLTTIPATASSLASCNSSNTVCDIPENVLLELPFFGISGDVVLTASNHSTVLDVFRIFNNYVDSGGGTGLGYFVYLYSANNPALPDPSTYSVNVRFIQKSASGATSYFGNGTEYLLATPEPQSAGMLLMAAAIMILAMRRKRTNSQAGDVR